MVMIEYMKLTTKELDTFIDMRIHQLREEGATEDIDLKPTLYEYYAKHMSDGTFVSWLAIDKQKSLAQVGFPLLKNHHILGV